MRLSPSARSVRVRVSTEGCRLAAWTLLAALCLCVSPRVAVAVARAVPAAMPVAEAAAPTGTVTGSVVDPARAPVPGAVVVLRSMAGLARESRTNVEGVFVFDEVSPGLYDIFVLLDGFRADTARVDVRAGVTTDVTVALRLSAITETMVVSASYVDTPLSDAPAGTMTFTAHDMDSRHATTVGDVLSLVPGVAVAANGGLGSVTSLFARGGESDFTLVMVDGVKLNSFGGGFDFGHLTTAGLSSLEVVRGPQSAVFGADAIGGVVQMRTAVGGPAAAAVSVQTGSLGSSRFVAGTTGSSGVVDWGAHVERLASDGWTGAAPGTNTPVSNDDYTGTNVSLGASWKASRGTVVRATGRFGRNERGNPGPFGSNPIGAFAGIDTVSRGKNELALASVALTHEWDSRTAVRLQGSWMRQNSDYASPWGSSMARTRRWTAHAQVDRAFGAAVSTSFGIDADLEQADNTFITGVSASQIPVNRHTVGYFGEARIRGGARLFVTTGLRLDHIVREALEADPFAFTPRPPLPADAIVSTNPRIAVNYDVRPASAANGATRSRVHASAGTGIRTPDAFEIAFTDNPGLQPERSRSVDMGFEQTLLGGRLVVDGTTFLNDYDHLIVAVGRLLAGSSRYRTDNIANARARGFEGSATWRTPFGIEARAAYTFVDSDVLAVDRADGTAPPPFAVGDPLIRRPRHQLSADVVLTRGRLTAHARAAGRGRVLDVEPTYGAFGGLFQAAGFTVVDAGASTRLGRSVELLVRANNVLGRHYESVFGYPSPGRTLTVGARLATGR